MRTHPNGKYIPKRSAQIKRKRREAKKDDRDGGVIMIKYYLFCIRWLWKNRNWSDTRQKYKAMNKAWNKRSKRNGR